MTSRRSSARRSRPYAWEKLAFAQDLEADPTLSGVQKGIIGAIAKNFDNGNQTSECSLTFLARAVGTTKKVVGKYTPIIVGSGRVSIVKRGGGGGHASTLWCVAWWFRGAGYVRVGNGGRPILDCRESPKAPPLESPKTSPALGDIVGDSTAPRVPHQGDQTLSSPKGERKTTRASGALPLRAAPSAVVDDEFAAMRPKGPPRTGCIENVEAMGQSIVVHMGGGFRRTIVWESDNFDEQQAGQAELGTLCAAANVNMEDGSELIGARVRLQQYADGHFAWRAA